MLNFYRPQQEKEVVILRILNAKREYDAQRRYDNEL